jgi:hypothetical protein
LLAVGAGTGMLPLAVAGGTMMVAAIPASLVFTNASTKGRMVFGTCMTAVLALGAFVAADMTANPNIDLGEGRSAPAFGLMVLIAMASTWLAMVPSLRKAKPE